MGLDPDRAASGLHPATQRRTISSAEIGGNGWREGGREEEEGGGEERSGGREGGRVIVL